jgi:hypothetical protein
MSRIFWSSSGNEKSTIGNSSRLLADRSAVGYAIGGNVL